MSKCGRFFQHLFPKYSALNARQQHLINRPVSVSMATELEGIKEVTEAILGIGEVAIDNFTFKVQLQVNDLNFLT